MAMNYCEVCGILIANALPGAPATICERCFASRKVLVASDPPSGDLTGSGQDRVQFQCPSCKSLLQLPPVRKRTKVKCPSCRGDFAMFPDGHTEVAGKTTKIDQERLLGDLKPRRELEDLLAKVPEKRGDALPSVLDSDQYGNQDSGSTDVQLEMLPHDVGPGEAAQSHGQGYVLLPDSDDKHQVPESRELEPVSAEPPKSKTKKIQTARRTKDQVYQQRKEKEDRARRAAEAQKHTVALMERRHRRAMATARLVGLAAAPVIVFGLCLMSTTQEGGFAVKGFLGKTFNDIGETARRGVEGVLTLAGKK